MGKVRPKFRKRSRTDHVSRLLDLAKRTGRDWPDRGWLSKLTPAGRKDVLALIKAYRQKQLPPHFTRRDMHDLIVSKYGKVLTIESFLTWLKVHA